MNIATEHTHTEEIQAVAVAGIISDAEPRLIHRHATVMWRPERVTIRWHREKTADGWWTEWSGRPIVSGPKVKKDGSNAKDSFVDRYPMSDEWDEWVSSTRPEKTS